MFKTKLIKIGSWTIIHLPKDESLKLPSRGLVMVSGKINDTKLHTVLEPDGLGSHWFKIDEKLQKEIDSKVGDTVTLTIESSNDWIEPEVPEDFIEDLKKSPKEYSLWKEITPNAHWDWIRWIQSTKDPKTRKRRIEVSISKLSKGMRRPCCFNRNMCCVPEVSNSGVLKNE